MAHDKRGERRRRRRRRRESFLSRAGYAIFFFKVSQKLNGHLLLTFAHAYQ